MMRGLANMRVDAILDPLTQRVTAIHLRMNFQEMERTIYLDGRPHPSANAAHTWSGFSTGTWQDNVLNVFTSHLKENYIRRNGIAASDKRTFTEHWVRHGNYLTVQTVVTDPALLAEPLVRSQTWILDPTQQLGRNICETANEVPKPAGSVPHHLPGTNPFLHEVADWYGLPAEATRGGPDTMYPEYPEAHGQAGEPASGAMRAVLQLRSGRRRLQSAVGRVMRATGPWSRSRVRRSWLSRPRRHSARNSRRPAIAPRSKCSPSRRTSTCSRAPAATSPCRSAAKASSWSIRALRRRRRR